jgi:hypothetical protein
MHLPLEIRGQSDSSGMGEMAAHEQVEETALNVSTIAWKEAAFLFIHRLPHLLEQHRKKSGLELLGCILQFLETRLIVNCSTHFAGERLRK